MIKEAYCSFEVSKLLKEKGFDEPCYQKYDNEGYLSFNHVGYINNEKPCDDFYALAPTHQMAIAWILEKYNFSIEAYVLKRNCWCYSIYKILTDKVEELCNAGPFESPYECVDAELKCALNWLF